MLDSKLSWPNIRIPTALLVIFGFVVADGDQMVYPFGDVRNCLRDMTNGQIGKMDSLPGSGWDNLQNVEKGMVFQHNYSLCRTSADQSYLIPDTTEVYVIKTHSYNSHADVIENWSDYTPDTVRRINLDPFYKEESDISGAFSDDARRVKETMIHGKTIMTRMHKRYVRYRAVVQPHVPLVPDFRSKLLNISSYLEQGHSRQARSKSQELVRDYGTHVVNGIDLGAVWIQEQHVSKCIMNTTHYTLNRLKAAAAYTLATKLGQFDVSLLGNATERAMFNTSFISNRRHTIIRSYGGGIDNGNNDSLSEWEATIGDNLVAVDRSGVPLHHIVNERNLPQLEENQRIKLAEFVREAINTYYKVNTVPGCKNMSAVNFSPLANIDDGNCAPALNKPNVQMESEKLAYRFGGLYQTCECVHGNELCPLCDSLSQVNPMTGNWSCPAGYGTVPLYSQKRHFKNVLPNCGSCFLGLAKFCQDDLITSTTIQYTSYWCSKTSKVPTTSDAAHRNGHVTKDVSSLSYGGAFTSNVPNIVTSSKTCPHSHVPLTLGEDVTVCVGEDDEDGQRVAVPFAGLFSCQAGNPMSLGKKSTSLLRRYAASGGPDAWPRFCPKGYNKVIVGVMAEDGCEVFQCIQIHELKDIKTIYLRQPPFIKASAPTPELSHSYETTATEKETQHIYFENANVRIELDLKSSLVIASILSASLTLVLFCLLRTMKRKIFGKQKFNGTNPSELNAGKLKVQNDWQYR